MLRGRRCAAAIAMLVLLLGVSCADESSQPRALRVTVTGSGLVDEVATASPAGSGRALTVAHVLRVGHPVRVSGRPAHVIRVDRRLDLAVLEVNGLEGPAVHRVQTGQDAMIRVLRDGRSVSIAARVERRVTATLHDPQSGRTHERPVLELHAAVLPGDSGAPVTDRHGRLAGIIFARADGDQHTAWALDLSRVRLRP